MKFLNDEYTLNIEYLGHKEQIDSIRELILECETPFSIGISGRWGSGKTSAMKYLMASIRGEPVKHRLNFRTKTIEEIEKFNALFNEHYEEKKDCDYVHTVWFNPWESEKHQEPTVALLQTIYNHFSFWIEAKEKANKLFAITIQSGLNMLGSYLKLGANQASNTKEMGEKYEYDNFQYIDRSEKFKFAFQEAIETLLMQEDNDKLSEPNEKARIVIFIDDLDRCEDETITTLLKEIKQYLATKRCVFVFGYDRYHIEKSFATNGSKTSKETRAYLEKLFQTTFYIKEPTKEKLKTFVAQNINDYDFIDESIRGAIADFIIEIVDANPRRLKSFLTTFYFHRKNSSFAEETNITEDDLKKLLLIAYLKQFYESVYSALENKPSMLESIVKVCQDKDRGKIDNAEKYFVYLEFLSHIHATTATDFLEDALRKDIIKNSKESETKFLAEVHQMQGKHRSFEKFQEHFAALFTGKPDIAKYL